ncbi:hypothetical protein M514_26071, partial [Trichuris suis]
QTATQESLEWTLDDQEALQRRAFIFFYQVLAPIKILDIVTTSFDKCSHKHRKPYGTGKFTLKVSCPNEDPSYCGLYGTRMDISEVMIVDCQFSAKLDGRPISREVTAEELCKKWSYPGTELPQLQLPGYLKSLDADILWYDTANLETFSEDNSKSQDVDTTRFIRNPYERTGFSGKGKITRIWRERGYVPRTNQFWVKQGTIDGDFIKRKVLKLNKYCKESEIGLMVKESQKYHRGYLKNKHNTDNAWLEGTIIHLHDDTGECFGPYPVHAEFESRRYSDVQYAEEYRILLEE